MGIFQHRPLAASLALMLLLSLLISGGSVLGASAPAVFAVCLILVVLAAAATAAFIVLAVRRTKKRTRFVVLAIAATLLLFGTVRVGGFFVRYAHLQSIVGERATVCLSVKERESATAGYTRYRVSVESVKYCENEFPASNFDAALVITSAAEYRVGDRLCVDAECLPLSEVYAAPAYALADGCCLGFTPVTRESAEEYDAEEGNTRESGAEEILNSVTLLAPAEESPLSLFRLVCVASRALQKRLSFIFTEELGGDVGALASAVLLGDKEPLDEGVTRDFSRAGISHLLAISGLHMSILIGGLALILRKLGLPKRAVSALMLVAIILFLLLTGFSMSACRAGVMLAFAAFLGFFARRPDAITSLFLAVSLIVFLFPSAILSVGLWLSFASVLGLLIFARIWESYYKAKLGVPTGAVRRIASRVLAFVLGGAGVSLIASFAILPILWIAGMEFSLYGVFTNLLTVSLMPLFLVCSILFLAVYPLHLFGTAVALILRLVGGWILSVASFVSEMPHAAVSLRYPFVGAAVAVFFLPTAVMLVVPLFAWKNMVRRLRGTQGNGVHKATKEKPMRARWFWIPPLAATAVYIVCFFAYSAALENAAPLPATVVRANVGEMIVLSDRGTGVLVDLSNGMSSGYRNARTAAGERGVTEWSAVVLTHYHSRQSASLSRFCRENLVRHVYLPAPETETDRTVMETLIDRLGAIGTGYTVYPRETVLTVGDTELILSDAVYFEHSTQPIFLLSLSRCGERLTYFTQAVGESALSGYAEELTAESTYLLYGSDGPVRREIYRIPTEQGRVALTYGEENVIFLSPISRRTLERGASAVWIHDAETVDVWDPLPAKAEVGAVNEETTETEGGK